jgi:hypothetical protein
MTEDGRRGWGVSGDAALSELDAALSELEDPRDPRL